MPSTFAWLDYSEHDRDAVNRLIDLFRERDTRDELGIGSIRDALSELLFPGTSTIQTRPKYFLFIPWVYQIAESYARWKRPSFAQVAGRAREEEIRLRHALVKEGEQEGVIGYEAGASLKRLPSSVYWNGMSVWGIRLFPGSLRQFHNALRFPSPRFRAAEAEGDYEAPRRDGYWHPGLLPKPQDFPNGQTLKLSLEEARYLQDRIRAMVPGTLLTWMVDNADPVDGVEAPWAHPQVGELPANLKSKLEHARNFAELMRGAALLYNLMLAEKRAWQERIDEYREAMANWAGRVEAENIRFGVWDRNAFWTTVFSVNPRVPQPTRRFVNAWLDLALEAPGPSALGESPVARELISKREESLKNGNARLHHLRALELWTGAAGTSLLTYRWSVVQWIIRDIRNGLNEEPSDA